MLKPADFMTYLLAEQAEGYNELELSELLSDDALSERGVALFDLKYVSEKKEGKYREILFFCSNNESKFKPGDEAILNTDEGKLNVQILESDYNQIAIRAAKKK